MQEGFKEDCSQVQRAIEASLPLDLVEEGEKPADGPDIKAFNEDNQSQSFYKIFKGCYVSFTITES